MPQQEQPEESSRIEGQNSYGLRSFGGSPLRSEGSTEESTVAASSYSTPLWTGSAFSANHTLEANKAALVLTLLECIDSGRRLEIPSPYTGEQGLDEQLEQRGLVHRLSDHEYRTELKQTRRIEAIVSSIESQATLIEAHSTSAAELQAKLDNGWRKFALSVTFRGGVIKQDQQDLDTYNHEIDAAKATTSKLEQEYADLLQKTREVAGYVVASTGSHVALTTKGHELLKALAESSASLGDISFSDFEARRLTIAPHGNQTDLQLDQLTVVPESDSEAVGANGSLVELSRKINRFAANFNALNERYADFEAEGHLDNLALASTLCHGSETTGIVAAQEFAACLLDYDLLYLEGFNAAAELMFRTGSPEQIRNDYHGTLNGMLAVGHRESVTTAVEATAVMDIPGSDLAAKHELQNRFREVMVDEGGWIYGAHSTCYIAAKLAATHAATDDAIFRAVREHKDLELALIDTGRTESVQLGYAALLLMDAPGTIAEKAQDFTEAFELLKQAGFENKTRLYPTAAQMLSHAGDLSQLAGQVSAVRQTLSDDYGIIDRFGTVSLSLVTGSNKLLPVIDKGSPSASARSRAGKESLR